MEREKKYSLYLKILVALLLPISCCLVHCGLQGKSIADVYLPMSEWNDELFYFKQVESIIHFGYPQGYYGFNESHALSLSFAAWSPVLVFPWVLWGLIFGWNLLSPILCNLFLLTVACVLFVWLVRPTWKQMGIWVLLFSLFRPFVRYTFCGMPEIICFSLLIVFYSLAINYLNREKLYKLVLLFVLSGVLTTMRPYLFLFMLLPAVLLIRRKKWLGAILSAMAMGVALIAYVMINHFLAAEYFLPLFFTDWITTFFTDGLFAGIHHFFGKLFWKGKEFLWHMGQGYKVGLASGAYFIGYVTMMCVLLWQTFSDYRIQKKKQDKKLLNWVIVEGHLAFCFVGMLMALLLMYKMTEGSKHLATFLAAGVFLVSLMNTKTFKKATLIGAVFAYLYLMKAVDPYDYRIPFREPVREAQVAACQETLGKEMKLTESNVPNYENVVIWTLGDRMSADDGAGNVLVPTKWQVLYGLPKGFGISCCEYDYVKEHLNANTLQSRYLMTASGGDLDADCKKAGYQALYRDHEVVIYRIQKSEGV